MKQLFHFPSPFAVIIIQKEDGTLIVNASYDNYAFNGYEVNGTFIYELPVEDGIIQGYRVNSDKNDAPTIIDIDSEEAVPTAFAITMGSDALAPAYGTIATSGATVTSHSGSASAPLPGTDVKISVGNDNFNADDVTEPYTKDQIPDDYYNICLINYPLTTLLMQKIQETGSTSVDLGNGNTCSIDYSNPQDVHAEINIVNPMHFTVSMNGATYTVHTTGTMKASVNGNSATMDFSKFAASITITQGGKSESIQTKAISGSYSGINTISGSLTIGNHRYSGSELQEMFSLVMADMIISSYWGSSEIEADGTYYNNMNSGEYDLISISGTFDSASSTLTGTLKYNTASYPLVAKVRISGTGAIIEKLAFNGYTYSDEAIATLRSAAELVSGLMQGI